MHKFASPGIKPGYFLLLLLSLLASGCHVHLNAPPAAEAAAATPFDFDIVERNTVYTDFDWPQALRADLYLPRKQGPLPVVLTIHAGGWANRSREEMADISEKLVQNGYAVFNIDHRFAPYYTYPAQLLDLQQALQWISRHAKLYQLDLDRISAWGYSSGAHLAALLGGIDENNLPDGSLPGLPRLRSVVAGGIPADLRKYESSGIVERFIGGSHDEMFDRYSDASPVVHVSSDDPAIFLYHGNLDFLVTTDQPRDYYAALLDAGVDAELYLHNWRGHGSMFLFGSEAESRAIAFLNRHNQQ